MKLNPGIGLSASCLLFYLARPLSGASPRNPRKETRSLNAEVQCGDSVCNSREKCVLNESTGGQECLCEDGYVGHLCMFKPCGGGLCSLNQDCVDDMASPAGQTCVCKAGYKGEGCHDDVNECLESEPKPCSFPGGFCENRWAFDGFYTCGCDTANGWMAADDAPIDPPGVTSCIDVDECSAEESPCHENATCVNLVPGFDCTCNAGLVGDGRETCAPPPSEIIVDPCDSKNCDESNSFCQLNSDGVPQCLCKAGFWQVAPDAGCVDLNECSDPDICPHGASCTNLEGGYICLCDDGYAGGGNVCTDIDECAEGSPCSENLQCVNRDGTYECVEPTPAPTPSPTPAPTNRPKPIPNPVPGPAPPGGGGSTPLGPVVETTSTIGNVDLTVSAQEKSDGSFDVAVADVGTVEVSTTQLSFTASNAPGGQLIKFSIPLPASVNFEGTHQNAAILSEFLLAQLAAAASASAAPQGRGRILDSPGCDLVPDTTCNLSCCALHDQCFDLNGCTALSWARTICEPALAAGFLGLVSLGPLGAVACTASLLFIDGKCSQCNSAAVACIALGCSGITDTSSEQCYDNICNIFYECAGECDLLSLDDTACCGCQTAGAACSAPPNCGNGVCDFGETSENCLTDCAFSEGCSQPGFINCGGPTCVDPLNDADNCGACGIKCPSSVSGVANACVLGSCTAPIGISWATDVTGILANGGWVITNNGKTIRYNIEDSANCEGPNGNIQTGTADATISISESFLLTLEIIGIAELEDGSFELMDVFLDGTLVVSATSTDLNLGCAMGPSIFTEIVPGPYTLTPGEHTFQITFTTADSLYHVDAFYELNLIFAPVTA